MRATDEQLGKAPKGLKPVPMAAGRRKSDKTPFKQMLLPYSLALLWLLAAWQISAGEFWKEPLVETGGRLLCSITLYKATKHYRVIQKRCVRRFAEKAISQMCTAFWLWAADEMACADVTAWAKSHDLPNPHPRAWCYMFAAMGIQSTAVWMWLVRSELTGKPLPESLRDDSGYRCLLIKNGESLVGK